MLPHHVRVGTGEPALVFIHGFACGLEDWDAQLAHFAPGHTVLACDLRGHGATPGQSAACSIETYGADVAALLRTLDPSKTVLIGHSMGCRVVLQGARDAPERVAGLVLVDGSCLGIGDAERASRAAGEAIAARGYGEFAQRMFEGMFLPSSDPALKARIVKRAGALPEAIGAALFPRMVAWDAHNMERVLAATTAPILVIQSSYLNTERVRVPLKPGDTTPWLDLVRARVPGAAVEVITGVGHFPQIEAADAVNRLIGEFVDAL